jgi:hypothetical protein
VKKDIFIILVTTFFKRVPWLAKIRDNHINRLFLKYKIKLHVERVKIKGPGHYELRNIFIKRSAIAFEIQRLELLLDLWTLIKKRAVKNAISIKVHKLEITCGPLSKSPVGETNTVPSNARKINSAWERVLYPKYEKIIHAFFFFIPERIIIQEFRILYPRQDMYVQGSIISSSGNLIKANLETTFKNNINKYLVECKVHKNNRSVTVAIDRNGAQPGNGLSPFSFSHLSVSFDQEEKDQNCKAIRWMARAADLRIQHGAIGAAPLLIGNFDAEAHIDFTPTSFAITKGSGGSINRIPFAFQFNHDIAEKDLLKFIFQIEFDFNVFKELFPAFHVKALKSITTEGSLLIRSQLMFSMKDPMQHSFDLKLLKNDLVISDLGDLDLSYLETPFVHRIYKDNAFLRELQVGDPNSNFVEIANFPAEFIDIITSCEDARFYQHHGIDVYYIGYAIVSNIVERKFKRGAGTITMQLVRNLFLNHEKSLSRKIEEVILTLLLENHFKIPKARLLEIYLNIIEFGPNVYGIGAASIFYFHKPAQALTLTEFIIMMYIIPRPIHFYDALISQSPRLFTNLKQHVLWQAEDLRNRGTVTNEESEKIINDIEVLCQSRSIIPEDIQNKQLAELLQVDLPVNNTINTRNDLNWAYPLNEEGMPTVNLKKIASANSRKEYIYNVIDWLDVEKSRRYAIQGKSTYCNIYAYDVVRCLGAYMPRIWWNEESILKIRNGIKVPVEYAKTVFELNCNLLAEWFLSYGPCFGWKQVSDLTKMQSLANNGTIGIIVAQRKVLTESGHITVVLPETAAVLAESSGQEIICPVQSQAGMQNKRCFTGDAWWQNAGKFSKHSIWIWDL